MTMYPYYEYVLCQSRGRSMLEFIMRCTWHIWAHQYINTNQCINEQGYACTHMHLHAPMPTHRRLCTRVCMVVHTYMHTCLHMHRHTQTPTHDARSRTQTFNNACLITVTTPHSQIIALNNTPNLHNHSSHYHSSTIIPTTSTSTIILTTDCQHTLPGCRGSWLNWIDVLCCFLTQLTWYRLLAHWKTCHFLIVYKYLDNFDRTLIILQTICRLYIIDLNCIDTITIWIAKISTMRKTM